MRERECEAEFHVDGCECQACHKTECGFCNNSSEDHFTPKSIARKILGWKPKEVRSQDNLQWLSRSCHRNKDATTPARLTALYQQRRGGEITLEDVQEWADQNKLNG